MPMESTPTGDHQETPEEKKARYERTHKAIVESGEFDTLPQHPFNEGDLVVSKDNIRLQKVYEVGDDTVLVGYDKGGESVRREVRKEDLRHFADFGARSGVTMLELNQE